jgi:putative ABC transport system permease protein
MTESPTGQLRAYRALLRLFPRRFSVRHAEAMERLFLDMCRDRTARRGRLGVAFWVRIGWDTIAHATVEWLLLIRRSSNSKTGYGWGDRMSSFLTDVRYTVRSVIRQPTYGVLVVLMMALAIAGNAAVFRVFNGLFLRPLPFEDAERLVDLDERAPRWDLEYTGMAYPDFVTWRRENRSFEEMGVFTTRGASLASDGPAEYVEVVQASHDVSAVLGFEPALGRFFTADEDRPEGPLVALLAHGFWEQRFGGDRDVVGRSVVLNSRSFEIIGVLPPEASFVGDAAAWIPLQAEDDAGGWWLDGVGRLKRGVTLGQAEDDLLAIHKGVIPDRPVNEITAPVVSLVRDRYLGEYRLGSWMLLAAVGIVLLIACANIAGLMLARSLAREREIGIRVAMGAGRGRLIRQLLTESVLLAGVGAALGTGLGVFGSETLVARMSEQFPRWVSFELDWRFVAFSLAATVGAAVVFGLAPALQSSRVAPGQALQASASRSTGAFHKRRSMNLLVAGEVAMALTLLIVAGLGMRDLIQLQRLDPGFQTERILTYSIGLPSVRYDGEESLHAFRETHLEGVRGIPAVTAATAASSLPLSGHWGWFFEVEGAPPRGEDDPNPVVLNRVVSPGYFETMGVSIASGRGFDDFDGREAGTMAAVVNETFVRQFIGAGEEAVGRRIRSGEDSDWLTIVGVARDVKHYGVDEDMRPGVYQTTTQFPLSRFQVAVRTSGDPHTVTDAVRELIRRADPELSIFAVQSMSERMEESLWTRRASVWLLAIFAGVALTLAVAGLYGVISYSVGQRTSEISIRMALGARREQVLRQVVRQGMLLVAAGVVVGLLASLATARVVSGVLVGISATDPLVYGGVTLLLLAVAALANFVPARRAARLEPMEALRKE